MNTTDNTTPFNEKDINWDELAAIGILRDELEESGELEALLAGKKTGIISLALILLGVDVEMDASLQLTRDSGEPILEIIGISPAEMNK
jgi:hypothetical protein